MSEQIKYTHNELVRAVERVQELTGFKKEVDASRVAGEILNNALDNMEKTVYGQVKDLEEGKSIPDGFDKGNEFKL